MSILHMVLQSQVLWLLPVLFLLPTVAAMPNAEKNSFPDLTFKVFSDFIFSHFSSQVTLATVLVLLFTMTENPELLSLHAWQQNTVYYDENTVQVSGWMKALANAMASQLGEKTETLFKKAELPLKEKSVNVLLGKKLDGFAKLLELFSYSKKGNFKGKLHPVSHSKMKPVLVICPDTIVCKALECNPCSLQHFTRDQDIPKVNIIKGRKNYQHVPVLTGRCPSCQTTYSADHEQFRVDETF